MRTLLLHIQLNMMTIQCDTSVVHMSRPRNRCSPQSRPSGNVSSSGSQKRGSHSKGARTPLRKSTADQTRTPQQPIVCTLVMWTVLPILKILRIAPSVRTWQVHLRMLLNLSPRGKIAVMVLSSGCFRWIYVAGLEVLLGL